MINKQLSLIKDSENAWEKEWKDMPEFIQENKQPVQKIIVSFESFEDVEKFAELVGYKLTKKSKSIWFPFRKNRDRTTRAYVDEE